MKLTISKTLVTLFAEPLFSAPAKGTHSLRLTPDVEHQRANFEWIGTDAIEGALPLDKVPSAVAVALRAGRTVEFTVYPTAVQVEGLTEGEVAMLVPRFYQQSEQPKTNHSPAHKRKPHYSRKPGYESFGSFSDSTLE